MNITSASNELTMSSREIAGVTGKKHGHVMRDIKSMFSDIGEDESKFGGIYLDAYKRQKPLFNLDRAHTDCLLTGYSAKARIKVIKRWHTLEAAQSKPVALTQDDQLLQLAQGVIRLTAERDEAIKTKALINDKRTATLMNKASQDAKKIKKLESKLQNAGSHVSLMAAKLPQRIDTEYKSNVQVWRILKSISLSMGLDIVKVKDERYGEVNTYHVDVIEQFKGEYL
jgi:phage regulator Rha-like protein